MRLTFLLIMLVLLTKYSTASHNGLRDELRFIHNEMGALRAENHKQNMEIASLKETVQLQNKTINQHEVTIKAITGDHPVSSAIIPRRKRPARLLPSSILRGKKKNETDEDHRNLFYGPPTNCSDLTRLGYTLNGFYQVNKATTNEEKILNITKLETIYCFFKQEGRYNPSLVEKPVIPSSLSNPFSSLYSALSAPLSSPSAFPLQNPLMENDAVYFFAMSTRMKGKYSNGRLTFHTADDEAGDIMENVGNSFNGVTGYFTAPKNGIYSFFYDTFGGNRGNGTKVDFYLNDIVVLSPFSTISEGGKGAMSYHITLKLKKNDSICLKATKRNDVINASVGSESFLESILGILLKPTTH